MATELIFKSCSLSYAEASVAMEILKRVGGKTFYRTDHVKVFDTLEFETRRTAIYRRESLALSTPEHLAPVFLMWPGRSFMVDVMGGAEIPLMDGSALPFFLALPPRNFDFMTPLFFAGGICGTPRMLLHTATCVFAPRKPSRWNIAWNGRIIPVGSVPVLACPFILQKTCIAFFRPEPSLRSRNMNWRGRTDSWKGWIPLAVCY